jgi:reverse transcriptase-like protein
VDSAPDHVAFRRVAKPGGGERILVRLPPHLERVYTVAVARAAPLVERALIPGVLGNRIDPRSTRGLALARWEPARRRYLRSAGDGARRAGAVLVSDVRDFYGSISAHAAARSLHELGAEPEVIESIGAFLEAIRGAGVRGLPIGPAPSAVLANAVLTRADRALAGLGVRHVRWVDDVVVFARDDVEARRAEHLLSRALESVGLSIAPEKTAVVPGGPQAAALLRGNVISPAPRGGTHDGATIIGE